MDKAVWNGKEVLVIDVSNNYELEKQIRKASGRKELFCPDPDCKLPVLKYCHGEIKGAYFAHLNNCNCDYADFDKKNTTQMRDVKLKIFNSFCSRSYNVQMDVKLIDRHYTHLLITLADQSQIAIELGTQRMTAKEIDFLTREYQKKGVGIKWLVISNSQNPVKENETFFMKRYQMNESAKKDVLILNFDGTKLTQHIEDKNEYLYKGRPLHSKNYPDVYSETGSLESLVIENGELSIQGFHERFQKWLVKKENAFQKRCQQLEQEESARKERDKKNRELFDREEQTKHKNSPDSTIGLIERQNQQAIDTNGTRLVKCTICGKIAQASEFSFYGGKGKRDLGECKDCMRKKYN